MTPQEIQARLTALLVHTDKLMAGIGEAADAAHTAGTTEQHARFEHIYWAMNDARGNIIAAMQYLYQGESK